MHTHCISCSEQIVSFIRNVSAYFRLSRMTDKFEITNGKGKDKRIGDVMIGNTVKAI